MTDDLKDRINKIELTKEVRTLVIKALGAYKRGEINEAALYYEEAAKLSEKLGHNNLAEQYRARVQSLKNKDRTIEQKISEKEEKSINMLSKAEEHIKKGEFGKAAKIFEEAAEIAPIDRAAEYRREANELYKKEREMEAIRNTIKLKEESKKKYAELLEKIKTNIDNGNIDAAVTYIEKAIAIAKELGKEDAVEKLRQEALNLKRQQIKKKEEVTKEKKGDDDRGSIVEEYTNTLSKLKDALTSNDFKNAFKLYLKAGELALQMGEPDRAELYRKQAEELKEKVKQQEEKEKLLKRKQELEDKIKKLNEKVQYDELIIYYTELIATLIDLNEPEDEVNKYKNKIEQLKLVKKRSELEEQAKKAVDEKNFEGALQLFKEAAKISLKIGDNYTYSTEIEKIKAKVEEVSTHRELIDERSIAIANAKRYLEEGKYDEAINEYKKAAQISEQLGEVEIAQSYRETAKRLDKDREIIEEKNKFIKDAEQVIKEKNYQLASDYFNQVAKFCEKLSEMKEAEKYRKKAQIILELSKIE